MKRILACLLSWALLLTSSRLTEAKSVAGDFFARPSDLPQFYLQPPANLGRVTDYFNAEGARGQGGAGDAKASQQPLVILIQDLHANYGVQKNITGLLEFLSTKFSSITPPHPHAPTPTRPFVVGVEGASGPLDHTLLAQFPNRLVAEKAAELLMRQAELTGAESYAVNTRQPWLLNGIENNVLYRRNLEVFRNTFAARQTMVSELQNIQTRFNRLSAKQSTPALHQIHRLEKAHADGKMSTANYVRQLLAIVPNRGILTPFHALRRFASNAEVSLTNEQIRASVFSFLQNVHHQFSAQERKHLEILGKTGDAAPYFLYLRDLIHTHQLFLAVPPLLARYLEYRHTVETSEIQQVLFEADELAFEAKRHAAADSANTLELIRIQRDLDLLLRVLNLQATENDLRAFGAREEALLATAEALLEPASARQSTPAQEISRTPRRSTSLLKTLISSCINYYALATLRNEPMVENTLALIQSSNAAERQSGKQNQVKLAALPLVAALPSTAVLIAGGFHTAPITHLLRRKNISYLVMTPHIEHLSDADHDLYVKRLLGQHVTESELQSCARTTLPLHNRFKKLLGRIDPRKPQPQTLQFSLDHAQKRATILSALKIAGAVLAGSDSRFKDGHAAAKSVHGKLSQEHFRISLLLLRLLIAGFALWDISASIADAVNTDAFLAGITPLGLIRRRPPPKTEPIAPKKPDSEETEAQALVQRIVQAIRIRYTPDELSGYLWLKRNNLPLPPGVLNGKHATIESIIREALAMENEAMQSLVMQGLAEPLVREQWTTPGFSSEATVLSKPNFKKHADNQDRAAALKAGGHVEIGLVADGVGGGMSGGQIAECVKTYLAAVLPLIVVQGASSQVAAQLDAAVIAAHQYLLDEIQRQNLPTNQESGTTILVCLTRPRLDEAGRSEVFLSYKGDSRAYLFKPDHTLTPLTIDALEAMPTEALPERRITGFPNLHRKLRRTFQPLLSSVLSSEELSNTSPQAQKAFRGRNQTSFLKAHVPVDSKTGKPQTLTLASANYLVPHGSQILLFSDFVPDVLTDKQIQTHQTLRQIIRAARKVSLRRIILIVKNATSLVDAAEALAWFRGRDDDATGVSIPITPGPTALMSWTDWLPWLRAKNYETNLPAGAAPPRLAETIPYEEARGLAMSSRSQAFTTPEQLDFESLLGVLTDEARYLLRLIVAVHQGIEPDAAPPLSPQTARDYLELSSEAREEAISWLGEQLGPKSGPFLRGGAAELAERTGDGTIHFLSMAQPSATPSPKDFTRTLWLGRPHGLSVTLQRRSTDDSLLYRTPGGQTLMQADPEAGPWVLGRTSQEDTPGITKIELPMGPDVSDAHLLIFYQNGSWWMQNMSNLGATFDEEGNPLPNGNNIPLFESSSPMESPLALDRWWKWLFLPAIAVHELGHLLAAKFFDFPVRSWKIIAKQPHVQLEPWEKTWGGQTSQENHRKTALRYWDALWTLRTAFLFNIAASALFALPAYIAFPSHPTLFYISAFLAVSNLILALLSLLTDNKDRRLRIHWRRSYLVNNALAKSRSITLAKLFDIIDTEDGRIDDLTRSERKAVRQLRLAS